MSTELQEQVETLRISGALDVYAVEAVHRQLTERLLAVPGLVLDLSEVPSCDLAGIQLLYAASKTAAGAGKNLRIGPLSPAVEHCCAAIGLPATHLTSPS